MNRDPGRSPDDDPQTLTPATNIRLALFRATGALRHASVDEARAQAGHYVNGDADHVSSEGIRKPGGREWYVLRELSEEIANQADRLGTAAAEPVVSPQAPVSLGTLDPFGPPDGAHTPLQPSLTDFVMFEGRSFRAGLGLELRDASIRVLVGTKGSGKTHYLRRMEAAMRQEHSVYVDAWHTDGPSTRAVAAVARWDSLASDTIERWRAIWRCAVLRSIGSHVLHNSDPAFHAARARVADRLRSACEGIIPEATSPESVYLAVASILEHFRSPREMDRYIASPKWGTLRLVISDALEVAPPFFTYLDGLDESFEAAPQEWLYCQLGLFRTVMEMVGDHPIGSRLHVVIAVRDLVYSAALQSEHATRYVGTAYIRTLTWDLSAISYFLNKKIEQLPTGSLLNPGDARGPVPQWLGLLSISNVAREKDELAETYLIRHTRLLPRDVVVLGNLLSDAIDRCRDEDTVLSEREVRATVAAAAREFGREQLQIVANHLVASQISREALDPAAEPEVRGDVFQRDVADGLAQLLAQVGSDRFDRKKFAALEFAARARFPESQDIMSLLWQHRLLGIVEDDDLLGGRTTFFGTLRGGLHRIPQDAGGFAFHPILASTLPSLHCVGDPVIPF
jgi:hypothetical protein